MAEKTDFNDVGEGFSDQINEAQSALEKAREWIAGLNSKDPDPGGWFEDKTLEVLTLLHDRSRPDYERAIFQARRAKVSIKDLKAAVESRSEDKTSQGGKPAITFELLDIEPLIMRRPLALLDGRAYAAIWPTVRATITESVNGKGERIKHDPPIVSTERSLMVIKGDGNIFGIGSNPIKNLDVTVKLSEIIPHDKVWSTPGVKAYRDGHRPNPQGVFRRMADVIDRFIDFDRSLADQRTMAELCACYALATWFLDAFNVIGFLWPGGDRGSGKTQLLTVIAEISYLGYVILSGGSFASIRDMADYGATLAFDDAEVLADPKKSDPDKRTLLLAGNRRGNTVPVKEPLPGGGWSTRHVNTFCPRLFSATRLPDPILASRTIIVPLVV
jgi:hypothetical protein